MTECEKNAPLPLVRLAGIGRSFGRVRANHDISLDIHAGRIMALLGENGAGKSTLMRILAGRLQPDTGHIVIDGRRTVLSTARTAIDAGIGMVYQHFTLVEAMTVAENVFLGQEGGFWLHPRQMRDKVAALAEIYQLAVDPSRRISTLSMGERQRVEILKLLLRQSRVLILDEPTAVLTPLETEQLFKAMRRMAGQGKAVVFISHKLSEVMAVADDIAILRKGEIVDTMPVADVASVGELARRMVGREVLLQIEKNPVPCGERVLKIRDLCSKALKAIDLELFQGEILGIVGVAGNGQKALAEIICGLLAPEAGEVEIMGREWGCFFARCRTETPLGYIPEDRLGIATCPDLDLRDNFLLTTRYGFCRGPWLLGKAAEGKARETLKIFQVRPANIFALARQLSGGNLQKMVLGREFYRQPRLIVAEQPTQGLDVAATEAVWRHLLEARTRAGILLITGDLNEALALSDRIAVMFGGRIMDVFEASDTHKVDRIGMLMAGISSAA
ncbi:ABC transporter ATP-binding protein [Desulfococcus multivorans]|uniref:ABC transporter related protein n=1 Tax=Desulfococcus multivorans DSM 2059 TaxID=1121405 RepID=S7UPG0_DESML|nr:ABC transporter ATP-binding protein [Desulfococcus multivorans]AOY59896.1 putative ABC transporter, ATP-binding protein [Desulfococcus multivorans]AQV02051.1 branched-chain amino acid ABC transporter ATP-binding protein [Desulfococcus multivorans]EPR35894.1 ABC transporter related protein [Desulfococcus multivorans DSM 2059]SJZ34704.1 nucleoside ABC transporter ATP-binding protein [Desulfococcus multivorans DSM 2059]